MENGTLQQFNTSYKDIANNTGISETQVYRVMNGEREGKAQHKALIRNYLESKGVPMEVIWQFPAFQGGSKMLKELIEKDVFNVSLSDRKEVFESESFQIAIAVMREALELRKFVAIIGESGAGKTSLVKYLEDMSYLDNNVIISNMHNHDFEKVRARNIYEALLFDIDPNEGPKRSTEALIRQVRQILASLHKEGKKVVLVVDEAHHINSKTLLALKDVWESTVGFSRLVGVILLGQEPLNSKLNEPRVKEVNNRVERVHLKSIKTKEEAKEYVEHLCALKEVELNNCIHEDVYDEIALKSQSFLSINVRMKKGIHNAILANSDKLTRLAFKNI